MKRGVSPVIATVLLVAITLTIAAIVFSFSQGFIADLSPPADCSKVLFDAGLYESESGTILEVNNLGNTDISGFDLVHMDESRGSIDLEVIDLEVKIGESLSQTIRTTINVVNGKTFTLIPRVKNAQDKVTSCEDTFGKSVTVTKV